MGHFTIIIDTCLQQFCIKDVWRLKNWMVTVDQG